MGKTVDSLAAPIGNIALTEAAGFPAQLLISVAPPNAIGIPSAGVGKAPAIAGSEPGYWYGNGKWQNGMVPEVRERSDKAGANCGLILGQSIKGTQIICIDGDMLTGDTLEDLPTKIAMEVRSKSLRAVVEKLGQPVWVRETRPGRFALLFRIAVEEFPGRKDVVFIRSERLGDLGKFEVLARGQQVVLAGQHPTTLKPISWHRTDKPADSHPAPPLEEIPLLPSRAALNDILEAILRELTKFQVTHERKRASADTVPSLMSAAARAEDQAPPNADVLVALLNDLPHDSRVTREDYTSVMHAAVGCSRALGLLKRATAEEIAEIGAAAVRWAARWVDPKGVGTTIEAEESKYVNDWTRVPTVYAGWGTLLSIGASLGLEDLRTQDAVNSFDFTAPAITVDPMHTAMSDVSIPFTVEDDVIAAEMTMNAEAYAAILEAIEAMPTAATGYLSNDAMSDPERPRLRRSDTLSVQQSDMQIADAVQKALEARAIYLENEKRWIVWMGKTTAWSFPAGERVVRTWIESALSTYVSRWFQTAPESLQSKLLSGSRVDTIEKMLRTRLGRTIEPEEAVNAFLIQTPIGAFDLRTGEPVEMNTQRSMVEMRTTDVAPLDVPTPYFDDVMDLMCGRDPDVVNWVMYYLGYLLLGNPVGHNLLVIHGPGGNGKGAFCRTVQRAMGSYAIEAHRGLVLESSKNAHKTALYDLKGKRYWFVSEISPGEQWNEAQVKSLTGGDRIQANKMHHNLTYFNSEGSFIIATNNLPKFSKIDDAILRRFFIISARLKPEVKDVQIEDKIRLNKELSGVLFKIMEKAKEIYANNYRMPATPTAMNRETNRYFDEQDQFFAWMRNETEATPTSNHGAPVVDLKKRYDAYVRRHAVEGESEDALGQVEMLTMGAFIGELRKNGCTVEVQHHEGRNIQVVLGIKLKIGLVANGAEDFEIKAA